MKKVMLLGILLAITGCATVVDRDFEKEEAEFIKQNGKLAKQDPFYAPSTPSDVFAGKQDGVRIVVHKTTSTKYEGMDLQNWIAILTNENDEAKCVVVNWKLMDFELISEHPDFLYLKPKEQVLNYAHLKQQIWNLDGTKFALPPSGYVHSMIVRPPNINKNEPCVFEDETIK